MTEHHAQPIPDLRIQTPCPKTWDQLAGDGAKRFCSECSLYVHDARQLTRREAGRLVSGATGRVCMRMQFDATGTPLFLDSGEATEKRVARPSVPARATRWVLSTVAAIAAACHGSEPVDSTSSEPLDPGQTNATTRMGQIAAPERLGDVAAPIPPKVELLGETIASQTEKH